VIVTNVDRVIEFLKTKKFPISTYDLSKKLNININHVEVICKYLEDLKIVEIGHGITKTYVKFVTKELSSIEIRRLKKQLSEKEICFNFLNENLNKLENPDITLKELDEIEEKYKTLIYKTLKDKKIIEDPKLIQKAYQFVEQYLYIRFIIMINSNTQDSPSEYLDSLHFGLSTIQTYQY
jgi:DNA-binding transcriptional regulator YhcF (GntR family)